MDREGEREGGRERERERERTKDNDKKRERERGEEGNCGSIDKHVRLEMRSRNYCRRAHIAHLESG